jgi:AraC-like DNA-binding protein
LRQPNLQRDLVCIGSGYKPANLHKWGPGVRDVYGLHYIVSGQGILETRSRAFQLHAGESFIIFPDNEVYYYPDHDDPWEYLWIEFSGEEAEQLLSMTELTPDRPVVPAAPIDLGSLYVQIENPITQRYEQLRADAKLHLLLSYYMEYYPSAAERDVTNYVSLAQAYIERSYWKSTLTVMDIVSAVNIDRSHLFRLFKEVTGMSVSAYLSAYRIRRACELLQTSGLSIKSIAYSVGYKDQLYFSKRFKEATSHTPSEYATLYGPDGLRQRNSTQFPVVL